MSGKGNVPHVPQRTSRQFPGTHFNRWEFASHERMNSRICRCCGEPMPEEGNVRSRNPNVCASCSSMADGMDNSTACETARFAPGQEATPARTDALARDRRVEKTAAPSVHHVSIRR